MTDDLKKERHSPQTEKILRQFLSLESCNANSASFNKNYDLAMKGNHDALVKPAPCDACEYVATTPAEIDWHESRNKGHECCPDNETPAAVPLCSMCGHAVTSCDCMMP